MFEGDVQNGGENKVKSGFMIEWSWEFPYSSRIGKKKKFKLNLKEYLYKNHRIKDIAIFHVETREPKASFGFGKVPYTNEHEYILLFY